jgi:phospholipase C
MPLSGIKHIVTLMMENRSFDNVLGYLYPQETPNFEGVEKTTLPNLWDGKEYWPQHGTDMIQPNPDPNEEYQYVYRQLYNDFSGPDPIPSPPSYPPNMQGFVTDYSKVKDVVATQAPVIMNCFRPEDVPVISTLAKSYAVCDHWYAPAPTQTFANRSFVHAGTSSGYVNNMWFVDDVLPELLINKSATIYNVLEQHGIDFRIYYGSPVKYLCNAYIAQEANRKYAEEGPGRRMLPLTQFFADLRDASKPLPPYVFLEPNFINNPWTGPENDEHPHAAAAAIGSPSNVLFGERLIFEVFEALAKRPEWDSTLLVITFDEHGGTFDHYPPSEQTVSPDGIVIPATKPGGFGFTFQRYGVRVPAVLVSPLIEEGTILNETYDHTSILKTVFEAFGIEGTLLAREAAANDLSAAITRSTPRKEIPKITPRQVPDFGAEQAFPDIPLTEFQVALLIAGVRRALHEHGLAALLAIGVDAVRFLVERDLPTLAKHGRLPSTHEHAMAIVGALRKLDGVLETN